MFISTFTITKIAYRITKNKYGYEVYGENWIRRKLQLISFYYKAKKGGNWYV
jgi:hypothetical protein